MIWQSQLLFFDKSMLRDDVHTKITLEQQEPAKSIMEPVNFEAKHDNFNLEF